MLELVDKYVWGAYAARRGGSSPPPGTDIHRTIISFFFWMASVYILFSKQLSRFYIGSCLEIKLRINQHLEKLYKNSFTAKANDWEVFLTIENLAYRQARNIERHVKNMKSKQYIDNLKKYPEIIEKLKVKFSDSTIWMRGCWPR